MSMETFLRLSQSQWQTVLERWSEARESESRFKIRMLETIDESMWRLGRRMVWKWLFPGKLKKAGETDMWPMPGDDKAMKKAIKKSTQTRFSDLAKRWNG